mmetsp:Transcript_58092/g.126293  ORF Transcript_58092/g.126293 Transcript_58092/m.126293 type:complete len:218 (-) Transcript_58092:49-702(-)
MPTWRRPVQERYPSPVGLGLLGVLGDLGESLHFDLPNAELGDSSAPGDMSGGEVGGLEVGGDRLLDRRPDLRMVELLLRRGVLAHDPSRLASTTGDKMPSCNDEGMLTPFFATDRLRNAKPGTPPVSAAAASAALASRRRISISKCDSLLSSASGSSSSSPSGSDRAKLRSTSAKGLAVFARFTDSYASFHSPFIFLDGERRMGRKRHSWEMGSSCE